MVDEWLRRLEARHLADLTFAETTRALRALSSTYVERRARLSERSAFDSAGKRAAYALYYSPLHFFTTAEIVRALALEAAHITHLLDVGCGAGAAGAAWASSLGRRPRVIGLDTHPWAVAEARFTYRCFGLDAETRRHDASRLRIPRPVDAVVAGWMLNETTSDARAHLHRTFLDAAGRGVRILVIEPIATRVTPWWSEWARAFEGAGGRADEWRFAVDLPDLIERFDRAAGLRHDELTARSLFVGRGDSD